MTDFPPTNPDQPSHLPKEQRRPRSTSRKLFKGLLWLGAGILILLMCAGLLLTYWFPSDMVRQQLETRLSALLKGTVRIESLSFNLLSGLHIRHAQFLREGHPPLTVETLQLDYSLWNLLQGTLRINEVAIGGADLVVNLPELSQGLPPEEPTIPPPTDQPLIPALPVTVDVNTLKILNTHVVVIVSPDLQVRMTGLNLTCSGGISPEMASLQGALDIKGLDLTFQDKNLQMPLMVAFDTSVHVASEQIEIAKLTIQSEPTLRLTLNGLIEHPLSEKTVALTLRETQIDLAQLLRLGHPFIPPEMEGLLVKGTLAPQITIKGSAPDGTFSGTMTGTLNGKGLEAALPAYEVQVHSTDFTINLTDLRVQHNAPIVGQMVVQSFMQQVRYQAYQISDLNLGMSGEFLDAGPFSGIVKISGKTTLPENMLGQAIPLPFEVNLTSTGNHKTQTLKVSDFQAKLGPYGHVQGTAAFEPRTPPSTSTDAGLEVRVFPQLDALIPLIPKALLGGITLHKKGTKPDSLQVQAKGVLNQEHLPEAANLATAIKLGSLRLHVKEPEADGTLENLAFLLSGDYQRATGTITGTVGLSTNLANLLVPQQLSVTRTTVTLKSGIRGQLSPSFQPTSLQSEDQLQVGLEGVVLTHPSVTATVPSLKWLSKTREDVLKHNVMVEGLRVTAPDIFEIGMKGGWKQSSKTYDVDFRMPLLRIDQLLPRLSGSLTEGWQDLNPTGLMSMSIQTAGSVPSEADIKALKLPLHFKATMSVKDAGGTLAGFGLQETNGTVSVAYAQTTNPPLQFLTDLHLQNILLPANLPIQQLPNTSLHIHVAAPSANEIQVKQLRATSNGLNTAMQGTIVGLQAFLNSPEPLGTRLANLFAELETSANVDLGVFQQVLTPLGIQGTGEAGVDLHVRKMEQGNLDSTIDVSMNQVSLQQNTSTIHEATGAIQLRKALTWQPSGSSKTKRSRFQPSDVIAQLQRLSKKEHTVTIKHLKAGPLAIENFSTHLHFKERALKLQNMSMNLLGGGLGGNVILSAEHPLRLSTWLEAAQLDLNQLVDPASRIAGDSEVAATIGLTALLQEETGALDLSQTELQLHITHIGQEALDRLLVFLDPQGSRPALASARAQLKLANPSDVTIEIARGLLNFTIHFQGSFIPTFHLDRIPLAKMKNMERLTAAIPNWEALSKILNMVGAESYAFTAEGELALQ